MMEWKIPVATHEAPKPNEFHIVQVPTEGHPIINQLIPATPMLHATIPQTISLSPYFQVESSQDTPNSNGIASQDESDMMPAKKKAKPHIDRFNGLSEEEVMKKMLPDHLKEGLDIVIVGINPSLTSAHVGHHYAGPGNHFWTCLSEAGLVPEQVTCYDDSRMLDYGIGFTNVCTRPTKGAADLTRKEMKAGAAVMLEKMRKYRPKIAVFNGKGIYEAFVGHKNFSMGRQPVTLENTDTIIFVMPSSSARCAQLPRAEDKLPFFVALRKLREFVRGERSHLPDSEVVFADYTEFRVTQPDPKSLRKAERRRKRKAEMAAAAAAAAAVAASGGNGAAMDGQGQMQVQQLVPAVQVQGQVQQVVISQAPQTPAKKGSKKSSGSSSKSSGVMAPPSTPKLGPTLTQAQPMSACPALLTSVPVTAVAVNPGCNQQLSPSMAGGRFITQASPGANPTAVVWPPNATALAVIHAAAASAAPGQGTTCWHPATAVQGQPTAGFIYQQAAAAPVTTTTTSAPATSTTSQIFCAAAPHQVVSQGIATHQQVAQLQQQQLQQQQQQQQQQPTIYQQHVFLQPASGNGFPLGPGTVTSGTSTATGIRFATDPTGAGMAGGAGGPGPGGVATVTASPYFTSLLLSDHQIITVTSVSQVAAAAAAAAAANKTPLLHLQPAPVPVSVAHTNSGGNTAATLAALALPAPSTLTLHPSHTSHTATSSTMACISSSNQTGQHDDVSSATGPNQGGGGGGQTAVFFPSAPSAVPVQPADCEDNMVTTSTDEKLVYTAL